MGGPEGVPVRTVRALLALLVSFSLGLSFVCKDTSTCAPRHEYSLQSSIHNINDSPKNSVKSVVGAVLSLTAAVTMASSTAHASTPEAAVVYFDSLEEAANFIKQNCKQILEASRDTGRLLYRGSGSGPGENILISDIKTTPTAAKISLESPSSDLLRPETYPSSLAADYFTSLESAMSKRATVRPSIGHLATSDILYASEWGTPVSVWPIDGSSGKLDYAWFRTEQRWWQDAWGTPQGVEKEKVLEQKRVVRGPLFWRNPKVLSKFLDEELVVNSGLQAVLANGGEIMFARSSNASSLPLQAPLPQFVAVPLQLEAKLLTLLGVIPFSVSAPVKRERVSEDSMVNWGDDDDVKTASRIAMDRREAGVSRRAAAAAKKKDKDNVDYIPMPSGGGAGKLSSKALGVGQKRSQKAIQLLPMGVNVD